MPRGEDAPVHHLNWGVTSDTKGSIGFKAAKCITCGTWAIVRNPQGDPQHKVCAEAEAGLREEQR